MICTGSCCSRMYTESCSRPKIMKYLVKSDVQCQLFPYKHKYTMSKKKKAHVEVDKEMAKVQESSKSPVRKIKFGENYRNLLGPSRLQIEIFS